jgi:D-glycero-alpha-D-manno-heptose-7-phosphate kinase
MIVTRTPFRVTLGGGGTDLPSYYSKHGGFIFAMGLDKYMYIMVGSPIVDDKIRLHYSRSETVDHVSELHHELAREALRSRGIERKIEISSMADLPAGTGLGSSSSYLVGLLAALRRYGGEDAPASVLAEDACHIELEVLGKGIGKQDQYMAAYGGLTVLDIDRGGEVAVRQVELPADSVETFVANTHLYYTGVQRSAEEVLRSQNEALGGGDRAGESPGATAGSEKSTATGRVVEDSLHRIKDLGHRILEVVEGGDFDGWGRLLHEHWSQKKRMSEKISLTAVDRIYERARAEYGVLGGKIAGAGGGGFLMLYAPDRHEELERFMATQGMPRLPYGVSYTGAEVMVDLRGGAGRSAPRVATESVAGT